MALSLYLLRSLSNRIPYSGVTLIGRRGKSKTVIAGLTERHRILVEGGIPPVEYEFEKDRWAKRERFGEFGMQSGVDIRELWPTVEEIDDQKALKMYRSAEEAMRISRESEEKKELRHQKRLAEIERNWENYDKEMDEFAGLQKEIADGTLDGDKDE